MIINITNQQQWYIRLRKNLVIEVKRVLNNWRISNPTNLELVCACDFILNTKMGYSNDYILRNLGIENHTELADELNSYGCFIDLVTKIKAEKQIPTRIIGNKRAVAYNPKIIYHRCRNNC